MEGEAEVMRYGSVCSGIEAASVAWEPLGWRASFFSEIEPFPRAVLAHRYPGVPLHGDFTTIESNQYEPIDILVGGTPCQSFSVAGLRGGMDDDRGNLALEFLRLADRTRPRWLVWENVPGVLSSNGGRDFGSIIGGMVQLGYGIAYRILDAQFFGVAQRRRRVFVVGHLGDWRRAASVLFERHSLQGHSAPSREAGKSVAGTLGGSSQSGGFCTTDLDNSGAFIPVTGKTLLSFGHAANPLDENLISFADQVRRLTPRECERLQGFPDDYTLVPNRGKPAADGPRYKALGNSMAVPVMRWIGQRIAAVETQKRASPLRLAQSQLRRKPPMTQTPATATIYDLFPPPQALSDAAWQDGYDLITKHKHKLRQYDLERVAWLCAKGPGRLTYADCQTIQGIYDRVMG